MQVLKSNDDQELIVLLRSGSEQAFKQIYDRYWDLLLNIAYKRLDSIAAAEEIIQDIFISLFIRRSDIILQASLEAYLKNALKYKIYDVFRNQVVHDKYIKHAVVYGNPSSVNPEQEYQLKELRQKIDKITQKMPPKCREVFMMCRMENMSNKSIAEKLGISVSTVEKHISKAKSILRTDLKEYHLEVLLITLYLFEK